MRYLVIMFVLVACEEIPTQETSRDSGSKELPPADGLSVKIVAFNGEEIGYFVSEIDEERILAYLPTPKNFYSVFNIETGHFEITEKIYFSDSECQGSAYTKKLDWPKLKMYVEAAGKGFVFLGSALGSQDTRSYFHEGSCVNTSIVTLEGQVGILSEQDRNKDLSEYAPLEIK